MERKRHLGYFTKSAMDGAGTFQHMPTMLSKAEIVAALRRLVDDKETTQATIANVMGVAEARVSEMFKGKYGLKVDQAKALVEHYEIGEPVVFNAKTLQAILKGLLAGRVPERDLALELPVLADALQYMLRRVSEQPTLRENPDALIEAARSAVSLSAPAKPR